MPAVEVGDRVRVVYEGEVSRLNTHDNELFYVESDLGPCHGSRYGTVTVIEKAKKPLKVGGVVRAGEFEACPVGTVLHDPNDGEVLLRVPSGWRRADRDQFVGHVSLACERVIVYLPTA